MADNSHTLIEVEDLAQRLNSDSDVFVFDCRFSLEDDQYGQDRYATDHIPSAQYAHLNQQLSAPVVPGVTGRHPLPAKESFASQIRQWGVTPGALVIAYDDSNGIFAARLWWMFRWLGHSSVLVLNGGIDAWTKAGHSLDRESPRYSQSSFQALSAITRSADADEVLNEVRNSEVLDDSGVHSRILADARALPRFRGDSEPLDPVAGHIPGAICLPFTENCHAGRFLAAGALRQRFNDAGIKPDTRVTCYCGSGVTAAHNILALVHAGFPEPILYAGSWSQWITDPARPISSGDQP